jgi:hypothetical protein
MTYWVVDENGAEWGPFSVEEAAQLGPAVTLVPVGDEWEG